MPSDAEVPNAGSTLTLTNVNRHSAGVYKCAASNGVGEDAVEEIHLQVLCECLRDTSVFRQEEPIPGPGRKLLIALERETGKERREAL